MEAGRRELGLQPGLPAGCGPRAVRRSLRCDLPVALGPAMVRDGTGGPALRQVGPAGPDWRVLRPWPCPGVPAPLARNDPSGLAPWRLRRGLGPALPPRNRRGLPDPLRERAGPGHRQSCSNPEARTPAFPAGYNRQGSTTYHDLRLSWNTPWRGEAALGIDNLFARQPPVAYSAPFHSHDVRRHEVPGRFWYLQYRQQW